MELYEKVAGGDINTVPFTDRACLVFRSQLQFKNFPITKAISNTGLCFISRTNISQLEIKLVAIKDKLAASNAALEQQNSDPKLKDQDREISGLNSRVEILEKEKLTLKELLNEAGIDFLAKKEEIEELAKIVSALKVIKEHWPWELLPWHTGTFVTFLTHLLKLSIFFLHHLSAILSFMLSKPRGRKLFRIV